MFSNKLLSLLVSLKTSAQALCFVCTSCLPSPVLLCVIGVAAAGAGRPASAATSSGQGASCKETTERNVRLHQTGHIDDTGMARSSRRKPFRHPLLQKPQGNIWIPPVISLKPDWSCQDWVTFFPLWLILQVAGSTCFNIWMMTKVTLESWVTWAAEQASTPIVGETKITCPPIKGITKTNKAKRGCSRGSFV